MFSRVFFISPGLNFESSTKEVKYPEGENGILIPMADTSFNVDGKQGVYDHKRGGIHIGGSTGRVPTPDVAVSVNNPEPGETMGAVLSGYGDGAVSQKIATTYSSPGATAADICTIFGKLSICNVATFNGLFISIQVGGIREFPNAELEHMSSMGDFDRVHTMEMIPPLSGLRGSRIIHERCAKAVTNKDVETSVSSTSKPSTIDARMLVNPDGENPRN